MRHKPKPLNSLNGDTQAAWHERAIERLRGTDV